MENQELIKKFLKRKQTINRSIKETISPGTLDQYQKALTYLSQDLNKPFNEASEDDIINHLSKRKLSERTKSQRIVIFRMFYSSINEGSLPACMKDIRPKNVKTDPKKYAKRVISPNDFQNILDHCKTPMQRALLEALWISGGRKASIQKLLLGDVSYDGRFTRLIIRVDKEDKTRDVIYDGRAEYLMKWVESLHPDAGKKGNEDKPLFVTDWGVDGGVRPIGPNYAWDLLDRICDKLHMRHIKTHDIRHTVATNMLKHGVPETHVKTMLGWSKSTKMLDVYDHNEIKDYQEFLERNEEITKPTYELLEKQKEELENIYMKKMKELEEKFKKYDKLMGLDKGLDKIIEEQKNH